MTMADRNGSGKANRFVGICIQRGGKGLGATFVLRNIIDNQGERYLTFDSTTGALMISVCVGLRRGDLLRTVQPSHSEDRGAEAGEEVGRQPDVPERRVARVQHGEPRHETRAPF